MGFSCGIRWEHLWVLCWKNALLLKNRGLKSLLFLCCPFLAMSFLMLMRYASVPRGTSGPMNYSSFNISGYDNRISKICKPPMSLAYAPNTTLAAGIMKRVLDILDVSNSQALGMETERILEEVLARDDAICGGIVFLFGNVTHLPEHIAYKIRLHSHSDWQTSSMHSNDPTHSSFTAYDSFGGWIPGYYHYGFLHVQRAVDLGIIQEVNGKFDFNSVNLQLKRYPHPHVNDSFIEFLKLSLSLIVLVSFSFVCDVICRDILLEKEKKLKELMRLMGIQSGVYWLSWFCKFFIYMLAVVVVITVGFYVKMSKQSQSLLIYTSPTVMFVFMFLYSMAVINFAFAISTFFSKASTGSTFGMLLFFLAFMPWKFMDSSWSMTTKIVAMLDLHLAMAYGCDRILHYEALGVGMQWSTITRPYGPGDGSSMLHVFMMLIVDTVLYGLITWYFNEVLPGEVGTVRPFYFPFLKSYWFGESVQESDENDILMAGNKDCFEKPADNVTVGIKIRGLTKVFGKKGIAAVNNLNLDLYEGCITALVGQNGAGKSTTIFMLMGYMSQTKGSICINGMNIKHSMDKIRGRIGFCPQYDALFDFLTVREHLIFFAKIKGCLLQRAESEVKDLINALQLTEKTNAMSMSLSGGMKRKLCIGNALIGDSKFVILDEPTAGLDPSSRRLIWDILKAQQKDRTMILSTHFMDEADLLGDQIVIMANGEAKCFGSPMFLKSRYGVGYHLTVVKQPDCNVQQLKTVIRGLVDDSKAESNVGSEISFILPQESTHKFKSLFETLEEQQESLGIESFGVSVTTMEDVFLRVGLGGEVNSKRHVVSETSNGDHNVVSVSGVALPKEPACVRNFLQFQGMFNKKFICSARNYWLTFNQLYIPIFIAIFLCLTIFKHLDTTDQLPLHLNLSHFAAPVVPFQLLHSGANVDAASNLARCYSQVVSSGRGSIVEVSNGTDMDDYLLKIANHSLDNYNSRYLIGATVDAVADKSSEEASIVGWFNNNAYHAIAISLSYVTNAVMRCFGQPGRSIEVVNHPLPQSLTEKLQTASMESSFVPLISSIAISFGMGIVISTFAVFVVSERVSGAKHIQLVSSASVFNFWAGAFVWDVINFMIPSAVVVIILICFQVPGYADGTVIWFVLLNFLLYAVSIIPCVYVVSFMFQVPSTAQAFVYCIIVLLILASRITLAVFSVVLHLQHSGKVLEWVFYALLPNFCFERAFQDLYRNFKGHQICPEIFGSMDQETYCQQTSNRTLTCCPGDCADSQFCLAPKSYYAWEFPGIGRSLVFMILQSVAFFILLSIIESTRGRVRCLPMRKRLRKRVQSEDRVELGTDLLTSRDSDVQDERERVLNMTVMEPVVVRELTKIFSSDFVAVDHLCLGIQKGECFGLLGVNGAGKTTCFRMLMGDLLPTSGDVFVGGHSVVKQRAEVYQLVGYCPQADNHIPQMTVRETLSMIACFRGITSSNRNKVVDNLMERLMLKENADKFTCMLSGGNQRKLSIAVALIGEPPIIFLDEPTTGMDPATRRVVWDTLIAMRDSGHTLVLTSHNMEECEALCTRVAIMVNGRLNCLGSIQQLKAKFAEGFSMMIKVRGGTFEMDALVQQVRAFMTNAFPDSVLKDRHQGLLSYQVHNPGLKWSYIFRAIEGSKDQLQIEDYSVSQTTLEQLFLSFARMQRESQKLERTWKEDLRDFLKSLLS